MPELQSGLNLVKQTVISIIRILRICIGKDKITHMLQVNLRRLVRTLDTSIINICKGSLPIKGQSLINGRVLAEILPDLLHQDLKITSGGYLRRKAHASQEATTDQKQFSDFIHYINIQMTHFNLFF